MLRPRTLQGRLTLLFGLATVLLCTLVGVTVVVQFRTTLRASLDDGLHGRFQTLARQISRGQPSSGSRSVGALPDTESFAQVLDSDGKVITAAPRALRNRSVLSRAERVPAARDQATLVRSVPPKAERARLRVGPGAMSGVRVVIVVGTSLDDTTKAEHRLELSLALGLPLLAALVTLGGWFVAGAALAPVRSMIEEADELSVREPGRRLSIPRGGEEIAELARRLNEVLARIEAAVAHERAFLDDASHELRTPIAIVRGEAELARMAVADGTETSVALDSLLEEVERLDALAANLLALARTRAGGAGDRRPVDLAVVARRAADQLARAHEESPVTITVEGDATVVGDEAALERAVANVLDNGLRHARSHVDVAVSTDGAAGEDAIIEVHDDGPGFPPELLGQAFDRFTRGGESRRATGGGAGLGLAIVDAIAAAHGGEAVAANHADGGAVVRIRLPRQAAATM